MAKYMAQFSYTEEGLQGLLEDGGSKRREASKQLIESLGGKLEAYYFAFGDYDGYAIYELPDNVSAAAGSLVVNNSGAVTVKTTVLLSPEELDQATQKSATYRPPGQ